MSLTITVRVGETTHEGRWPFQGCDYVEVPGADCPTCASKSALQDHSGRIVALAGVEGMKAARAAFPQAEVIAPPDKGSLRVRLPSYAQGHDRYTGDAECCRCRQKVGPMEVVVSTLFGLEEDERVLQGRCRVY